MLLAGSGDKHTGALLPSKVDTGAGITIVVVEEVARGARKSMAGVGASRPSVATSCSFHCETTNAGT